MPLLRKSHTYLSTIISELTVRSPSNDVKRIKTYAIDSYQDTQLKLLKKRSQEYLYKRRFHGERSPTRILSIRAMEGYLSPEEPRFGNRFMAHILVKFDTEQVRTPPFIFTLYPNSTFTCITEP